MELLVLGSVLLASLAAGTAIDWSRTREEPVGLSVRLDAGASRQTDHLHSTGVGQGPPPLYVDIALQQRFGRRLFVGLTGGLAGALGYSVYPNVRFGLIDREHVSLTVGAGPRFQNLETGLSAFGAADLTAEVALGSTFILSAGADLALSLQRKGAPRCGADTCEGYLARGDHIAILRAGLGFRI